MCCLHFDTFWLNKTQYHKWMLLLTKWPLPYFLQGSSISYCKQYCCYIFKKNSYCDNGKVAIFPFVDIMTSCCTETWKNGWNGATLSGARLITKRASVVWKRFVYKRSHVQQTTEICKKTVTKKQKKSIIINLHHHLKQKTRARQPLWTLDQQWFKAFCLE